MITACGGSSSQSRVTYKPLSSVSVVRRLIMPMSKKQLEKKNQAKKAELADLEKKAEAGDSDAKKKMAKLKKKMK